MMKKLLTYFAAFLILYSCKKDEDDPIIIPEPTPIYHSFQGEIGAHDNSTTVSADNNLLICGNTTGNICVLKVAKSGSQLWRKEFKAQYFSWASGLAESSSQEVFVCGTTYKYYSISEHNILLIKLDANGDTLWTKIYGGDQDDFGNFIIPTNDDHLLICGHSYSFSDEGDIYLIKVNTNGDTLWTKNYFASGNQFPRHILQTQNGEYLITNTSLDSDSNTELYFLKLSADGQQLWNKKVSPGIGKWGFSTIELSNGDLVTCGKIEKGDDDQILIVKTDSQGKVLWEHEYGNTFLQERGNVIKSNADGTFTITGWSHSTHSGTNQIVLLKINPNGDQIFFKEFGGHFSDSGDNLLKDDNDDNIITGDFNGAIYMTRTDSDGVFK